MQIELPQERIGNLLYPCRCYIKCLLILLGFLMYMRMHDIPLFQHPEDLHQHLIILNYVYRHHLQALSLLKLLNLLETGRSIVLGFGAPANYVPAEHLVAQQNH